MSDHTINPIPTDQFRDLQRRPLGAEPPRDPRGLQDPTAQRLNESLNREFDRQVGKRKTVRPIAIADQQLLGETRIPNTLDGRVTNLTPDSPATGGFLASVGRLSGGSPFTIARGFLQFPAPLASIRSLTLFPLIASFNNSGVASFAYSLELDFITTVDFKIGDVTFNNQGSLTFEKLVGFEKLLDISMTQNTGINQTYTTRWGLPLGRHTLASGNPITGLRIKFTTEIDLGGTFWAHTGNVTFEGVYV